MKRLFIILLSLSLFSCGGVKTKDTKGPSIAVSIEPQHYFVQALAHGFFNITCMVPRGSNPETYDPTPRQLVELEKSNAYLRIGYIGFEQSWMDRLTSNTPHLKTFDLSQGIDLISLGAKPEKIDHHLVQVEPHVWCSPKNVCIIVDNIRKILITLDNKNEKVYTNRCDSLQKKIAEVDKFIRAELANNTANHSFAIYHPSLSYFARDYGLQQIVIEDNGKEPSPSDLKVVINKCKAANVHIVFVQPEFDRRNAEVIAKQIGARVVPINPLNYYWDKEMIAIAKALGSNK